MILTWKHIEIKDGKEKETNVQMDVQLKKSVDTDKGYSGNYICNECENKVEQAYICQKCGLIHLYEGDKKDRNRLRFNLNLLNGIKTTIGKIEKRKHDLTGIIYREQDKKDFMEQSVDEFIKVEKEIPYEDVVDYIDMIRESKFEVYNNESETSQSTIRQIHGFLNDKKVALLVSFGYRGEERGGLIISTKDKLSLIPLLSANAIRENYAIGISKRVSKLSDMMHNITEDLRPKLYKEFLMLVKDKKPITKPKVVIEKPIEVTVPEFLSGF